jgi:hypothetical protein
MAKRAGVYQIIDPRTDKPFYVGMTANLDTRKHMHRQAKIYRTKSRIIALHKLGLLPIFRLLAMPNALYADMRRAELRMIAQLHNAGADLVNSPDDIAEALNANDMPYEDEEPQQ